jgi:hypothetical protein
MIGPVQLLMIETGCYLFLCPFDGCHLVKCRKGSCHIHYIGNKTTNLPLSSSLWTDLGWLTYYPKHGSHQFYYSPPKTFYLELMYLLVIDPTSHPKLVLNQFSSLLASLRKYKDIMADRSAGLLEDSLFKRLVINGCLTFFIYISAPSHKAKLIPWKRNPSWLCCLRCTSLGRCFCLIIHTYDFLVCEKFV